MRCAIGALILGVLMATPLASAKQGDPILCERVPDGTISVDGLRGDWKALSPLEMGGAYARGGDKERWQGNPDLLAKLRCAHDSNGTYLLVEVDDDQVVRTPRFTTQEDRVELLFKDDKGRLRELQIHPPSQEQPKPRVRWTTAPYNPNGIQSSVIRLKHGYAVELGIRTGGVPGFAVGSPVLPMTLRIVDHDGGPTKSPDTVLLTGGETAPTLGRIEYDTPKNLYAQFLKDKGLTQKNVLYYEVGNFITGPALEQLVIAGTWVAFIGEDVMKGGAYYAFPVEMAKSQSHMLRFRTLDLDGTGKRYVILVLRQEGTQGLSRDIMMILRFLDAGRPEISLALEVALRRGADMELTNKYRFVPRGKQYELEVTTGTVRGWSKGNHVPTGGEGLENILTPWGTARKTYTFASDGAREK